MLSREQKNVERYLQSGALLYEVFPSEHEVPMREMLFALDTAVASFGRTEMAIRQFERDDASGRGQVGMSVDEALRRFQDSGLEALDTARDGLGEFRRTLKERFKDVEVKPETAERRLRVFERGLRCELSDLELKPKDVARLVEQLDEVMAVARRTDPYALLDLIDAKLGELAEVRRRDDRGNVDNIPWWKIVAVAVFFAITIWGLMRCVWGWFGPRCSPNEGLIYVLIGKAAALGYYLC